MRVVLKQKKRYDGSMAGNTFGTLFRVTTFGESHGTALGCVVDGCPAGLDIDQSYIQHELDRRKPGGSQRNAAVTARTEADTAEILSGVFEGKTTGTPIAILIRNTDQHPKDYSAIKDMFRPGHADYTYQQKYGIRDYRGGGRSSGRETCGRVAAGAIARLFLKAQNISIVAYTKRAAGISCESLNLEEIEQNPLRAPDNAAAERMAEKIEAYRAEGNSCGGIVECVVQGLPPGIGEPVFNKLDAQLAQAMLSIGAIKGIEFGAGFSVSDSTGLKNNDGMKHGDSNMQFTTNNAGGILGGMSSGAPVVFRVAVKPVPSIFKPQQTVNTDGEDCTITIQGRHDVCLCPRIVPVVEAMTAITLADLLLQNRTSRMAT